jgi:ubiquitin C-terminal hydrolase
MQCKESNKCINFEGEDVWKCDDCRRMFPKIKGLIDWFEKI